MLEFKTREGFTYIAQPRGIDDWGDGSWGARRGTRRHKGVDYAIGDEDLVLSPVDGEITKIGFPYRPRDKGKNHFRYVQVTNDKGFSHRMFYVSPLVPVGVKVNKGDVIGTMQTLQKIYPGIVDHVHYEVMDKDGARHNPEEFA